MRAVRLFALAFVSLLVTLAIWQAVQEHTRRSHVADYAVSQLAGAFAESGDNDLEGRSAAGDPLGITDAADDAATYEKERGSADIADAANGAEALADNKTCRLEFQSASGDGSILWYASDGDYISTGTALDAALVARGWTALSGAAVSTSGEWPISSYMHAGSGRSLIVSITGQPDGCAAVITVL
jgi:hypothetical protein